MDGISYAKCALDFDGSLAILTLRDPDRLNAIGEDMIDDCHRALMEVAKPRRGVRALLVRGEGRAFCAGANIGARLSGDASALPPTLSRVEAVFHPFMRRFRSVSVPIVVAVRGACVGIGVAMALCADHLIVADDAYFLVPFRNLASAPDSGLTWLLPRAVGIARAREMLLRASRVDAARAVEWGLANEAVALDMFEQRALERAMEFATGPTIALGEMKKLLDVADGRGLDAQMEAEVRAVLVTARSRDNAAALRAMSRKEAPQFTGE